MISRNTIDTVFETARVEEVIGDFVQLKRAGSNLKGLSPFTDEKSASFMVSPSKQIWKDFSSGKGGNVVSFLMDHEHFSFPEAIRFLAKKYNIEIEETEQSTEEKEQASEKESMYLVSEFAKEYFHKTLLSTQEGKAIGLTYFKERGFNNQSIEKFGLGYSPNNWTAFTDEALKKGYKLEFLEKTGLTIVSENKKTDRFRARVMFPIQSLSGRVLGFGGRILTNDKKTAKYLNSPESEIYHKSKILYGIYQAKQSISKNDNCYLVEGYTDVIQFHQSGIENVVASSGTALTPDQIRLISRLTKNITVLFDGDAAGLRASIRGIDLILEEGMNVKVCTFPQGEDPDSFAKKTSFEDLLSYLNENAKDFIQFKASLLNEQTQKDPMKKAELINDMVASVSKISDRIKREIYIKEVSRIMDISEEVLVNTLAQLLQKEINETAQKKTEQNKKIEAVKTAKKQDFLEIIEENLLKILLNHGNKLLSFEDEHHVLNQDGELEIKTFKKEYKVYDRIYLNLHDDEIEFSNEQFQKIYKHIIDTYQVENSLDLEKFISEIPQELSINISSLYFSDQKYHLDKWESKNIFPRTKDQEDVILQNVNETILNLRCYLIYKLIYDLMHQTKGKDSQIDNSEILDDIKQYQKLRNLLLARLGNIAPLNHYHSQSKTQKT